MTKSELQHALVSTAPDGTVFNIPSAEERRFEWLQLKSRAETGRAQGLKIVVVQGLGFVGSAVAAVVAGARDAQGKPLYFVLGTDLATPAGYWKVAKINEGKVPIPSPDPALAKLLYQAVCVDQNLSATTSSEAYSIADIIVIDLPFDVSDRFVQSPEQVSVELTSFENAVRMIGAHMRSDALVIAESTVPIGVCEKVVLPRLRQERAARGIQQPVLLAHAYERVMPGPNYVGSIRSFWRSFAGADDSSTRAAAAFLSSFVQTDQYPLFDLKDMRASEMAKVLENSYRAVNIAFIYEWTLLAEQIGVNLFEVINSIRVRRGTHDNMRFPGFGVGGYCLTKDPLLAQWSATHLFQTKVELAMTIEALRINQQMPLHTFNLALELASGSLKDKHVAVCGISYLPEVPDTRNTPAETLVDALLDAGALVLAQDPLLTVWPERPTVPFSADIEQCLSWADGLILATPHSCYRQALPEGLLRRGRCRFLVDAQNGIDDVTASSLHSAGIVVAGVGKGHWRKEGFHNL